MVATVVLVSRVVLVCPERMACVDLWVSRVCPVNLVMLARAALIPRAPREIAVNVVRTALMVCPDFLETLD